MALFQTIIIFGKPLIFYLGLITITLVLSTAATGFLVMKGLRIPLRIHTWLARITILMALIHGAVGIAMYI